ncbi:hypothetical protein ACFFX0_07465 [Citricoccus parietis]|uniref:Uncharacterized protein n=1 Tax=Citricoccus parietis TaxID=592307 RepID=A0ABV5FWI8_9MICC
MDNLTRRTDVGATMRRRPRSGGGPDRRRPSRFHRGGPSDDFRPSTPDERGFHASRSRAHAAPDRRGHRSDRLGNALYPAFRLLSGRGRVPAAARRRDPCRTGGGRRPLLRPGSGRCPGPGVVPGGLPAVA